MDHIGMDVHKKESQLCILTEGGELTVSDIKTFSDAPSAAAACDPAGNEPEEGVPLSSFLIQRG